ncbi:peptidoglycan-binding protein [Amycolatopsis sp.]|uniref:peptidoglycan-binding protein n=1 Tax=Amycolatopsis sp. TaxID=37632 RepID=UPI002D7E96B6|nr:peptidoglycan-binding protein [Amycolatopsis sp.]HET6708971.1 peptidoglycan-binding protein [Amycolatopsis sp.]
MTAGPGVARRRRRRRAGLAAVTVAVLATTGVVGFTRWSVKGRTEAPKTPSAPATAEVVKTDLVDRITVTGKVGYGPGRPVTSARPGTLTWLPDPGAVIDRGRPLYAVDAKPVIVLFGRTPAYRDIAEGAEGPDVRILRENLAALGYRTADKTGTFGASTTAALKRWQKALRVEQTGRIALGDVVVVPAAVRVATVSAQLGAPAAGEVLTVGGTERLVTVELEEAQRGHAAVDAKVRIEPGSHNTPGTIRAITAKSADDKSGGKTTKYDVTIAPDDPRANLAEGASVDVGFDGEKHAGVLVVPVEALLAPREGGYALEVIEGASRRLIPVELGLFADGKVEVSGRGLAAGMRVVTAS